MIHAARRSGFPGAARVVVAAEDAERSGRYPPSVAFRSELESARERADVAEAESRRLRAELEAQRERIERVTEVEAQLEAARASARARARDGRGVASGWLPALILGGAIGGGLAGLYWGARLEAAEAEREASRVELASAVREGFRRTEEARSETARERDAVHAERHRAAAAREEDRAVLVRMLNRDGPAPDLNLTAELGTVLRTEGPAPAAQGTVCRVVALPAGDACVGRIECGAAHHAFGCAEPGTSHLELDYDTLRIVHDLRWRVEIGPLRRGRHAPSESPFAPYVVLPEPDSWE